MTQAPCRFCEDRPPLGFDFTFAFQPIVDVETETVFAYEALVRGLDGSSAGSILSKVDETNRYQFDQACRVKAIEWASINFPKGGAEKISINFLPNAVYRPEACLRASITAAEACGFPLDRIIFEVTEEEQVSDTGKIKEIIAAYQKFGLSTAIDDFGAGYAGLSLLAEFQPDIIKIDMKIVHDLDHDPVRRAIVHGIVTTARELGITVIAEGIETVDEYLTLRHMGISLFQGFLFARPAFEALPEIHYPEIIPRKIGEAAVA